MPDSVDGEAQGEPATDTEVVFARNVREMRARLGLSQDDLAKRMAEKGHSFHQATIYKIETGARRIQLSEAVALSEVLGTTVQELLQEPNDQLIQEVRTARQRLQTLRRRVGQTLYDLKAASSDLQSKEDALQRYLEYLTNQENQLQEEIQGRDPETEKYTVLDRQSRLRYVQDRAAETLQQLTWIREQRLKEPIYVTETGAYDDQNDGKEEKD